MRTRTKLAALGVVSALAVAPVLNAAHAAGTVAPVKTDTATAQTPAATTTASTDQAAKILQTSDEILGAMHDVRAARLAIYNGEVDQAKSMTEKAASALQMARNDASSISVQTAKATEAGDAYLPFDTSISFAEGFQPTADKAGKIQEANQQLASGDQQKAVETLRLADVDIVVNAALLPVNASLEHVDAAAKLIADGSYYQANLALKAVEDAVVLDTYAIDGIPVQGAAG
ncbi:YfdX family protein [Tropicimonas sp. IMCC34043]|uniref:YfdX family protein n=1 Tax=Tropicimonas sp. IMCC34043 TaxID=2248760 RepID=UPI000E224E6A|nr:YfdX family protein [Tropicimonas sp. IMCC34043]